MSSKLHAVVLKKGVTVFDMIKDVRRIWWDKILSYEETITNENLIETLNVLRMLYKLNFTVYEIDDEVYLIPFQYGYSFWNQMNKFADIFVEIYYSTVVDSYNEKYETLINQIEELGKQGLYLKVYIFDDEFSYDSARLFEFLLKQKRKEWGEPLTTTSHILVQTDDNMLEVKIENNVT